MKIPIEISARHIHLSEADFKALFGENAELKAEKNLSQPGEFASPFRIKILGANGTFLNARLIGPLRAKSQVEVAISDARTLGLNPPLRSSGNTANSSAVTLEYNGQKIKLKEGLIINLRHLHLDQTTADILKVNNNDVLSIKTNGLRAATLHDVIVRIGNFKPTLHIDTDEANACGLTEESEGEIII